MRQRTCAWQLTKTLAIGVQKSTQENVFCYGQDPKPTEANLVIFLPLHSAKEAPYMLSLLKNKDHKFTVQLDAIRHTMFQHTLDLLQVGSLILKVCLSYRKHDR